MTIVVGDFFQTVETRQHVWPAGRADLHISLADGKPVPSGPTGAS
ncbi:hypothetical protein ACIBBE_24235 [Streptomyces sp. NPDC051644]